VWRRGEVTVNGVKEGAYGVHIKENFPKRPSSTNQHTLTIKNNSLIFCNWLG
jgi:hypothetical protein